MVGERIRDFRTAEHFGLRLPDRQAENLLPHSRLPFRAAARGPTRSRPAFWLIPKVQRSAVNRARRTVDGEPAALTDAERAMRPAVRLPSMPGYRCPACGLLCDIDQRYTTTRWPDGMAEPLLLCCPKCDARLEPQEVKVKGRQKAVGPRLDAARAQSELRKVGTISEPAADAC